MSPQHHASKPNGEATAAEVPTTEGSLAVRNLQAQLDGLEQRAAAGRLSVEGRAEHIALLSLRGQVLGRIGDAERADHLAEQLVHHAPRAGEAFLARARTRGAFHRFAEGLSDLDEAEHLGMTETEVQAERAAIFQGLGRFDEALAIRAAQARRRRDFVTVGALAVVHAELGVTAAAEMLFDESRERYRAVTPFPPALLELQRGRMWHDQGDLERAGSWFTAACRRLPAFAPAQAHLAEIEAGRGEIESALARLTPLATDSDDPAYAAQLGRLLAESNRTEEARRWLAGAAVGYTALVDRHPAAYAEHAAEFRLTTRTYQLIPCGIWDTAELALAGV
jgi:tetratricopeptide (TPR) repeat protein